MRDLPMCNCGSVRFRCRACDEPFDFRDEPPNVGEELGGWSLEERTPGEPGAALPPDVREAMDSVLAECVRLLAVVYGRNSIPENSALRKGVELLRKHFNLTEPA